jgi:hypothetical protein
VATVNFSVPEAVRERFNRTFRNQNKSAIIAKLMDEAVEREERRRISREASRRIRDRHAKAPARSTEELRTSRQRDRS